MRQLLKHTGLFIGLLIMVYSCNNTSFSSGSSHTQSSDFEADSIVMSKLMASYSFYQGNDLPKALEEAKKLHEVAQRVNRPKWKALSYYQLTDVYILLGKLDSALVACEHMLEESKATNNDFLHGNGLAYKAQIYIDQGDIEKGFSFYVEALKWNRSKNDTVALATTLLNLGASYAYYFNENKKAKAYVEDALDLFIATKDTANIAICFANLGEMDDMKLYLQYAPQALALYQAAKNVDGMAFVYNNWGAYYTDRERWEEAIPNFEKALELWESVGNLPRVASVSNSLADCYVIRGDTQRARYFVEKAFQIAQDVGSLEEIVEAYAVLSSYYEYVGDYEKALKYLKQSNDSLAALSSVQVMETTLDLDEKYQSTEKNKQITAQQLVLTNQQNIILWLSIGAVVVFLFLLVVFQRYRYRQTLKKQAAEQELLLQKSEAKRLEEINAIKSTFLANISHELRTPLTLLLSPLYAMADKSLKGNAADYFDVMIENGENLQVLIDQLLNIARLEKGQWPEKRDVVDLWSQLQVMANAFDAHAVRSAISYEFQLPKDALFVNIDLDKLKPIVLNLLSNAFKYTPAQGKVIFNAKILDKEQLQIKVEDSGQGISEADLPHVFSRFYRVDGQIDGPEKGTGIGLAFVKELVDWFEGTIEVISELDKGSLFTVVLPIELATKQAIEKITVIEERIEENSEKPVVLVVEDHPDVLHLLSEQLSAHFTIIQANNGRIGLEKATERIPDVVITDVMMPEMDGRTLCKALKEQAVTSHIPVIMLTALSHRDEKIKGLEVQADYYMAKPFNLQELQLIIKNLLLARENMSQYLQQRGVLSISKSTLPSMEKVFLEQVIAAIETRLDDEKMTIVDLAKAVNLSRSQLHRKLGALTGKTPSQFMRKLRLQHAKQMLEQRAGTVTEVAYACGFNTLSYFSRTFVEEYGQPPSAFLQK